MSRQALLRMPHSRTVNTVIVIGQPSSQNSSSICTSGMLESIPLFGTTKISACAADCLECITLLYFDRQPGCWMSHGTLLPPIHQSTACCLAHHSNVQHAAALPPSKCCYPPSLPCRVAPHSLWSPCRTQRATSRHVTMVLAFRT